MSITFGPELVGTSLLHATLIGGVLFALTVPLALRAADRERQPWLAKLILAGLFLHFAGAVLQVLVVRVAYDNSADFHRYDGQGAVLAQAWRGGSFTMAGLDLGDSIPGTGMVSVITGAIYTVTGVDQLGGFFVFSWLSLLGLMAFYRAFRTAVPTGQHQRYAAMIFLLPSLFYWPSVAGKEAIMTLALGGMTLGAALLLHGHWSGAAPAVAGAVIGGLVRPHQVALLFGAFAVALLTRKAVRRTLVSPLRWVATLVGVGLLAALFARVTATFLGVTDFSPTALVETINDANEATQGAGTGFGSSHASWNPSPLYFPYDVYLVLFKPLPFEVRSATQAFAALENLTIMALIAASWRSLGSVLRRLRDVPFVVMCVLYSVGFVYIFSALGNVGLLARERTLLFPLFFVLLALPSSRRSDRQRDVSGQGRDGRFSTLDPVSGAARRDYRGEVAGASP